MRIVAAVFADFAHTSLGAASQLDSRIGSRTIFGHTLHRLVRVPGIDQRVLIVQPRDEGAAATAVRELGLADAVDVATIDDGMRPRRELIRSARKWNLRAWRGSPLGTTWFDEFVEPLAVGRVLDHLECHAVLCLDGHQPALDVEIADAMVRHAREQDASSGLVFTQAPPGVAGVILGRQVVRDLLEKQLPIGLMLSYRPEIPQMDPITSPACLRIPAEVAQTSARLTGDTRYAREILTRAFAAFGEDCDALTLCRWLGENAPSRDEPLPLEIELEITTEASLPETTLRPRGNRVPRRILDDIDAVGALAVQLAEWDDRLIVLGGHGDPLRHPAFGEICRRIRAAGVCGLGVTTPLLELTDENLRVLIEHRVDIVEVQLDADTPETYRAVHGVDCFERVVANIERVQTARREHQSPQPIIVPSLTRAAATLNELEPFFDRWVRSSGWATIRGYSGFGGKLPADTLAPMAPLVREPCRRLESRMTLLADGRAVLCDQDVEGRVSLGAWIGQSLVDLWRGPRLREAREAHSRGDLDAWPLCTGCTEWNRP